MPAITSGKVLVSGANGYIAVWIVKFLLEQGFSVRGTVRSEAKTTHLKELFKSYGDKLELVVVEDITKDGAFDQAVEGVDAILHTASPFHFNANDPSELIAPAVAGTGSILQSARKFGPNVKRIVVLSSCASIVESNRPLPVTFSEEDWNNYSINEVETKGDKSTAPDKYRASKTLAEKAAWRYYELHKSEVKWDLVCLNPPFVFGPFLHEVASPEALNTSAKDWYNSVLKGNITPQNLKAFQGSWVDVRDIAFAHVLALQKQEAGDNRIIVCADPFRWQDFIYEAHKIAPEVPNPEPSYDPATTDWPSKYDVSKEAKLLGIKYKTRAETAKDTIDDFKKRGWF
ncbi:hypothetical protein QCA50_013700 [Cerrena zonata]|uniref:NAD-dependent epimerase/dehydratase domain-containing protein n=1 Tax=Cerrena zonata TaxID=2478898 RepID=A0AAW0FZE7_9APHY